MKAIQSPYLKLILLILIVVSLSGCQSEKDDVIHNIEHKDFEIEYTHYPENDDFLFSVISVDQSGAFTKKIYHSVERVQVMKGYYNHQELVDFLIYAVGNGISDFTKKTYSNKIDQDEERIYIKVRIDGVEFKVGGNPSEKEFYKITELRKQFLELNKSYEYVAYRKLVDLNTDNINESIAIEKNNRTNMDGEVCKSPYKLVLYNSVDEILDTCVVKGHQLTLAKDAIVSLKDYNGDGRLDFALQCEDSAGRNGLKLYSVSVEDGFQPLLIDQNSKVLENDFERSSIEFELPLMGHNGFVNYKQNYEGDHVYQYYKWQSNSFIKSSEIIEKHKLHSNVYSFVEDDFSTVYPLFSQRQFLLANDVVTIEIKSSNPAVYASFSDSHIIDLIRGISELLVNGEPYTGVMTDEDILMEIILKSDVHEKKLLIGEGYGIYDDNMKYTYSHDFYDQMVEFITEGFAKVYINLPKDIETYTLENLKSNSKVIVTDGKWRHQLEAVLNTADSGVEVDQFETSDYELKLSYTIDDETFSMFITENKIYFDRRLYELNVSEYKRLVDIIEKKE